MLLTPKVCWKGSNICKFYYRICAKYILPECIVNLNVNRCIIQYSAALLQLSRFARTWLRPCNSLKTERTYLKERILNLYL